MEPTEKSKNDNFIPLAKIDAFLQPQFYPSPCFSFNPSLRHLVQGHESLTNQPTNQNLDREQQAFHAYVLTALPCIALLLSSASFYQPLCLFYQVFLSRRLPYFALYHTDIILLLSHAHCLSQTACHSVVLPPTVCCHKP
ncbi:hypothetical protein Pmani_027551 [Petrolisthes manimaculis]|uniref:Uncharacterized protein n=1 Tax=Petrolisthes manimaculis TaxID=1843537 RepID=A0AAE1TWD5_9EUCA|nr:hypothetical protein Pmani_027551 [Petrolisthes manimaculis]